ncbi:DnaJ domain-containing protein [Russula compacta]|nr:DnaJ domain-containing protein [Russula compacta]
MTSFPDYYDILNIPKNAPTEEVRQAYRRESLKTHPDRLFNASIEEKSVATEKFQAVADAYYVLSDPQRRREYDRLSSSKSSSERTSDPRASSNFFSTFASMFSSGAAGDGQPGAAPDQQPGQRPNADRVFGDVFEDLLRPEVERHLPLWTWLGAACGAGLGFITANVPGLVVGAYAGNRLGAIRDAKGKSVAAVFAELGGAQKAEILRALALKVLGVAYT